MVIREVQALISLPAAKSSPSGTPVGGMPACAVRRTGQPAAYAKVPCGGGLISINAGWHVGNDHAILFDAPNG